MTEKALREALADAKRGFGEIYRCLEKRLHDEAMLNAGAMEARMSRALAAPVETAPVTQAQIDEIMSTTKPFTVERGLAVDRVLGPSPSSLAAVDRPGRTRIIPGWIQCPDCQGSAEHVYNDHNGDPAWDYAVPCATCTTGEE